MKHIPHRTGSMENIRFQADIPDHYHAAYQKRRQCKWYYKQHNRFNASDAIIPRLGRSIRLRNPQAICRLRNRPNRILVGFLAQPLPDFGYQMLQVDHDAIFLGMTFWQSHLLDLDFPLRLLVLTQDDREGHASCFC